MPNTEKKQCEVRCPVYPSSYRPLCFHRASVLSFITVPSGISLLTSSPVWRQKERHTKKSLFSPEIKQEKFPHPSKQLKISDSVQGTTQIKEMPVVLRPGK